MLSLRDPRANELISAAEPHRSCSRFKMDAADPVVNSVEFYEVLAARQYALANGRDSPFTSAD